jgi:hypothetical protein
MQDEIPEYMDFKYKRLMFEDNKKVMRSMLMSILEKERKKVQEEERKKAEKERKKAEKEKKKAIEELLLKQVKSLLKNKKKPKEIKETLLLTDKQYLSLRRKLQKSR